MDKKIMIGMFSVLVLAMFVVGFNIGNVGDNLVGDGLNYHSSVCPSLKRAGSDEWVSFDCEENTVTNNGLNYVKDCIGNGGTNDINTLALGKTTAPAVGETALAGLWATCGLTKAVATYNSNGDGNWSQAYTWTSSCDDSVVNTTALYKAATVEGMFAGTTFTATTLQTDDSLKVNYTVWVS